MYVLAIAADEREICLAELCDGGIERQSRTPIPSPMSRPTGSLEALDACVDAIATHTTDICAVALVGSRSPSPGTRGAVRTRLRSLLPEGARTRLQAGEARPSPTRPGMIQLLETRLGMTHEEARTLVIDCQPNSALAASLLYDSPFDEALIVSEIETRQGSQISIHLGDRKSLRLARTIPARKTLAGLTRTACMLAGLSPADGLQRLTHLAENGRPTYVAKLLADVVTIHPDGSSRVDPRYDATFSQSPAPAAELARSLGLASRGGGPITPEEGANLARSVVEIARQSTQSLLRHLTLAYGERNVCLGGTMLPGADVSELAPPGVTIYRRLLEPSEECPSLARGAALALYRSKGGECCLKPVPGGAEDRARPKDDLPPQSIPQASMSIAHTSEHRAECPFCANQSALRADEADCGKHQQQP